MIWICTTLLQLVTYLLVASLRWPELVLPKIAIFGRFGFLRVFSHLLRNGSKDLAENAYLGRTNHYLQLFYWHALKNSSLRSKIRFYAFFGHFWEFLAIFSSESASMRLKMHRNIVKIIIYNFSIDTKARKGHLLVISGDFGSFWGVKNWVVTDFNHFLEYFCLDSAENAYLSRTDHYLQLFYWHQGLKRSSFSHFWSFWVILGGQKLGFHGFGPFSRVWRLRIDWNCIETLESN